MEPIIIKTAWGLLSNGKLERDLVFLIEEGKFSYIGKNSPSISIPRGAMKFEFSKGIAIPPFINGHTHLPETLIRGLCDDEDLDIWLNSHVWKVEPQMTPSDAKNGALLGIAEMISTGTIGFIDQFYYSDQIAESVKETGMKAILAPSVFEGNAETGTIEAAYAENLRLLEKWHKYDNRIFVGFGPHALYSLDMEWYEKMYEVAVTHETYIHTHLNETQKEVLESKKTWGMSPIQRMAHHGILDKVLAAHCVSLDQTDISLLKKNNTTVLHNPQSNLKLGSGIAPIPVLLKEGINVIIGTDGSASNNNLSVLEELRTAAMLHKGITNNPKVMSTKLTFELGTVNGSRVFPDASYTGELAQGHVADLTVFDLSNISSTPIIHPLSNLLYSTSDADCRLTVSNGKLLYENGSFHTLNIEKVLMNAQTSTESMVKKANYPVNS